MAVEISSVQLNPTKDVAIRVVVSNGTSALSSYNNLTIFISDTAHGESSGHSKRVILGDSVGSRVVVDFEKKNVSGGENFSEINYSISGIIIGDSGATQIEASGGGHYTVLYKPAPVEGDDKDYKYSVTTAVAPAATLNVILTTLNVETVQSYHINITHFNSAGTAIENIVSLQHVLGGTPVNGDIKILRFTVDESSNPVLTIGGTSQPTDLNVIEGDKYEVSVFAEGPGGQTLSSLSEVVTVDNTPDKLTVTGFSNPTEPPDNIEATVTLQNDNYTSLTLFNKILFTFVQSDAQENVLTKEVAYSTTGDLNTNGGSDSFVFTDQAGDPDGKITVNFIESKTYNLTVKVNSKSWQDDPFNTSNTEVWSTASNSMSLQVQAKPAVGAGNLIIRYSKLYQILAFQNFALTYNSRFVNVDDTARINNFKMTPTSTSTEAISGALLYPAITITKLENGNFGDCWFTNAEFVASEPHEVTFDVNYEYEGSVKTFTHSCGTVKPRFKYAVPTSLSFNGNNLSSSVFYHNASGDIHLDNLKFSATYDNTTIDDYTRFLHLLILDIYRLDENGNIDSVVATESRTISDNITYGNETWEVSKSKAGITRADLGVNLKAVISVKSMTKSGTTSDDPIGSSGSETLSSITSKVFKLSSETGVNAVDTSTGKISLYPTGLQITNIFLYRNQKYQRFTTSMEGTLFSDLIQGSTTKAELTLPAEFTSNTGHVGNSAGSVTNVLIVYSSVMNTNNQGIIALSVADVS